MKWYLTPIDRLTNVKPPERYIKEYNSYKEFMGVKDEMAIITSESIAAFWGVGASKCFMSEEEILDMEKRQKIKEELKQELDTKYEELQLAFKAIHDEYVVSDEFQEWVAAKEAWEETDAYKTEPEKYLGNIIYGKLVSWDGFATKPSHEEYDLYKKFCCLSRYLDGSYDGNFNLQCPGCSNAQGKFNLKRKLLLIEYGLPSDTKLPSEWYLGGYEWDWS